MSRAVFIRIVQGVLSISVLVSITGISSCNAMCRGVDANGDPTTFACQICYDGLADECSTTSWSIEGGSACTVADQPKEPDGTPCEDGAGACVSGKCVVDAAVCGDGVVAGAEACDDGANNGTGEGSCLADCSGTQICGDGTANGTEFCDATDTVDCTTLGFIGGTAGCDSACAAWEESSCTMLSDCGDGEIDPGEACDDGVNMGGDGGCLACMGVQTCGDGVPEGTEDCDDGVLNGTGEGQCLSDCSATQVCGDGTQAGTEVCDDGAENGTGNDKCLADCSGTQTCGDGTEAGTEVCDDGVDNGTGDGLCLADCSGTQSCGDGVKNGTEFCENGEEATCVDLSGGFIGGVAPCDAACEAWDVSNCTTPTDCGDGVQDPGESCDDGANDGGDGECLACMGLQTCGDGTAEGTESCDAGNQNGSGPGVCVGDCSGVQTCGDSIPNGTEVCDDGINDGGPNGCLPGCLGFQTCGDGVQNGTEACDDGTNNGMGDGNCLTDCSATQTCGDGIQNGTEVCDIGDTASCTGLDPGFLGGTALCDVTSCAGYDLSTCTTPADCGNGVVDDGEFCDDGTNLGGEGLCVACQAIQTCGDGTQNGTETCDDGNTENSDGCDADCTVGFIACDITGSTCPSGTSCYPTGSVFFGKSDFCLTTGEMPDTAVCGPPNDCQAGLACTPTPADPTNTRCTPICGGTIACSNGDECIALGPPSVLGACLLEACDLFAQDCNAGACYPLSIETGSTVFDGNYCWDEGSVAPGASCTVSDDCQIGFACGSIDGAPPVCVEVCDLGNPVCPTGSTCTPTSNPDFGACQADGT